MSFENQDTTFNPDQFLDSATNEVFETEFSPVPVGDYTAEITEVKMNRYDSKKEVGKHVFKLDVKFKLDAADVVEAHGRTVKMDVWLDMEGDRLAAGKNKNITLGRLRKACNQLQPGVSWSPRMLVGNRVKVNVTQRLGEGEHEGKTFNDVKAVTNL